MTGMTEYEHENFILNIVKTNWLNVEVWRRNPEILHNYRSKDIFKLKSFVWISPEIVIIRVSLSVLLLPIEFQP